MIDDWRLQRIAGDLSGKRVLEPSCGYGFITRNLCEMGADVLSFDVRAGNIDRAQELCYSQGFTPKLIEMDADQIATLGRFDVIVHFGLLYHLEQPLTHLEVVLGLTDELWLDTHVCEDHAAAWVNDNCRGAWWYEGADDYAAKPGQARSWWTTRDELRRTMEGLGFTVEQLLDDPNAANGRRVLYRSRRK